MRHSVAATIAVCTLITSIVAACGDNTGPGEDALPVALVGTWSATPACSPTCSFTLRLVADTTKKLDLVASTNVSVHLALTAAGVANLSFAGLSVPGTARIEGNTLYLSGAGSVDTVDYAVSGNTLNLSFRSPLLFADLTGDGGTDATYARGVLKK